MRREGFESGINQALFTNRLRGYKTDIANLDITSENPLERSMAVLAYGAGSAKVERIYGEGELDLDIKELLKKPVTYRFKSDQDFLAALNRLNNLVSEHNKA